MEQPSKAGTQRTHTPACVRHDVTSMAAFACSTVFSIYGDIEITGPVRAQKRPGPCSSEPGPGDGPPRTEQGCVISTPSAPVPSSKQRELWSRLSPRALSPVHARLPARAPRAWPPSASCSRGRSILQVVTKDGVNVGGSLEVMAFSMDELSFHLVLLGSTHQKYCTLSYWEKKKSNP